MGQAGPAVARGGREVLVSGCARFAGSPESPGNYGRSSAGTGGVARIAPFAARWPCQSFLELGALPGAAPCARLHARQVLWEWGPLEWEGIDSARPVLAGFQCRHGDGAGGTWAYPGDLVAVACRCPSRGDLSGSGAVPCGGCVRGAPRRTWANPTRSALTEDEGVLC